ncbi:helix-turn-helix domain-containing protein [Halapricum hydrolyticum]|uniref:Helix-turn-helix domain-containing protein n=2 Tax=Halapricum hydrolyticum TaxID=2979991 RepID=A0AAE3IE03_9EURY|nr:helix-turn-helix domain-containing protein [Halapricum hydrolyticum]MCU4719635.1 helix-turn-helix domain-containing protein [Halapricum hydrolyticum]MCU4728557.1 helix-turn-helix domain-containing protein [Halapricum hydrolyticum]
MVNDDKPVIADVEVPIVDLIPGATPETVRDVSLDLTAVIRNDETVVLQLLVPRRERYEAREILARLDAEIIDEITVGSATMLLVEILDHFDGTLDPPEDNEGSVLRGVRADGRWLFRIQFPDRERMRDQMAQWNRDDRAVKLLSLFTKTYGADSNPYGLSLTDCVTLRTAYEAGYFTVPQETSLSELGEDLGVSDTVVSRRIRRALDTLLARIFSQEAAYANCRSTERRDMY